MSSHAFNSALHPRSTDGTFTATTHSDEVPSLTAGPRALTREELVITGQAAPSSPALSEVTRMAHHSRRQMAEAIKAHDTVMLTAAAAHVRDALPGAKEVRLRTTRIGDQQMVPTFARTADDDFIGANYDKGSNADWARRTVEGADPGSLADALAGITANSEIWDTDPRCDYDPSTEEHIIYLDGRRRQEH